MISLVMIERNGGDGIRRAVESAREICSEVIIIDQSDDDCSLKIAKEVADIVIRREPVGNADPYRQWAYSLAHNPWVLSLDADEYLVQKNSLLETIKKYPVDIIWFRFRNIVDDYDIEEVLPNDWHPRLFKPNLIKWPPQLHTFPQLESPFIGFSKSAYIVHDRSYEKLKKAHAARAHLLDERSRLLEKKFLENLDNFLRIKKNEARRTEGRTEFEKDLLNPENGWVGR